MTQPIRPERLSRALLVLLVAALTALAGCAAPVRDDDAWEDDAAAEAGDGVILETTESTTTTTTTETEPLLPPSDEPAPNASLRKVETGTGVFINPEAAARAPDGPTSGDVTFNWENIPVQVVVKAILGDLLGENYVIAPGVQGTVTFATAKPINSNQALAVLEQALAWNNLALVYKDGRYTVLPTGQAIAGNLSPRVGPLRGQRGFEVRVVPLRYVAATEMEKLLAPYAKPGAIVRADNARSLLVLGGTATELQTYIDTIDTFDVNWLKGMSVGMYPLERVEAKDIVPELEKIFGEGGPTPLAGMFRFLPIERMNAVLVITPQPEYLAEAERWLGRLDRGGSEAGAQLFVYYVKNVKATDLAEKLTEIFAAGSSRTTTTRSSTPVAGVVPGVESVEIKAINDRRQEDKPAEPAVIQESVPGATGGDGIAIVASDDIRISAIEDSNALLVRATPGQYDAILKAINRLDTVPLQVHIEAKILQVDLTGNFEYGVQWFFENATAPNTNNAFINYRRTNRGFGDPTRAQRDAWNSFAGTITAAEGLTWTFLNTSAEALISAIDSQTNAEVVAAPSLVVLNNKEASFNVGQQIPVNAVSFGGFNPVSPTPTDPTTPGTGGFNNAFNSVQFRDTGIILNVTPRVNPGGLVYLEISQENSSPAGDPDANGNVPINKTEIETEIAVQSGQTVLLGGLIKDQKTKGRDGVPYLSRIPVLGGLFGTRGRLETRQEILILITPTVIGNDRDARELTDDYRRRFKGLQPLLKRDAAETAAPEPR